MMIIMATEASTDQVANVVARVESEGLQAHLVHGEERTVIGVVGDIRHVNREAFRRLSGVAGIVPISRPYKLSSREFIQEDSSFPLDGISIGSQDLVIIAGPCSVEDRSQLLETAHAVREAGAESCAVGLTSRARHPMLFRG